MARLEQIGGQVKSELDDFIALCNELKPTSYLEIGAREGIALRYFVERVPTITHVTAVDLPGAEWGRAGSDAALDGNLEALSAETWPIYADSQALLTWSDVTRAHYRYDVVFIDADHSYEGVKRDFELYAPFANMIVALHDINHPPDSKAYGPTKLWNEIDSWHQITKEFIDHDWGSRKGIGVIYV